MSMAAAPPLAPAGGGDGYSGPGPGAGKAQATVTMGDGGRRRATDATGTLKGSTAPCHVLWRHEQRRLVINLSGDENDSDGDGDDADADADDHDGAWLFSRTYARKAGTCPCWQCPSVA